MGGFFMFLLKLLRNPIVLIIIAGLFVFWFLFYSPISLRNQVRSVGKNGKFEKTKKTLLSCLTSVETKKKFFSSYDIESSIYKCFKLIYDRVNENTVLAVKFMRYYDYDAKPQTDYLKDRVKENEALVEKLSDLFDLVLRIEDSTRQDDMTYANDMLDSLKQMLSEAGRK